MAIELINCLATWLNAFPVTEGYTNGEQIINTKTHHKIDNVIYHLTDSHADDIACIQNQGIQVDDNHEPMQKNIPWV